MQMRDLMIKVAVAATIAKIRFEDHLKDETGAVNVVEIVILIAIAVALALFFKDEIVKLVTDLLDGSTEKARTAGNAVTTKGSN